MEAPRLEPRARGESRILEPEVKVCIMLAVRLPKGLEKRLDKLAKSTGRTKSFYVRQALEENFDDIEDSKLAMVGYPILSKVTTAIRTCLTAKD